jgi:hypothetical protein
MKGRRATAARVMLVVAIAAAAVIVANVALLGVLEGRDEPVGKLRPGIALTSPLTQPPATGEGTPPATVPTVPVGTVDDEGKEGDGGEDD